MLLKRLYWLNIKLFSQFRNFLSASKFWG